MDPSFSGPSKIPSSNIARKMGSSAWGNFTGSDAYHASSDATLFSSSLPVFPHEKININDTNGCQSIDDVSSSFNELQLEMKGDNSLEDETHAIGSLLPDDEDELLAGLTDGYDLTGLARQEELEDYDLFGNVGGLELENDTQENLNIITPKISVPDGVVENGMAQFNLPNGIGSVAGEHPYGEHPSRTLFVRNINSNVEDSELRTLFEQYGDIRTLYTTCKHRGFVMISYYDIRSARYAMRALQNKPLRRRKLDIHFSIPKDNPSDKDINQGTLVVFNLDPSVSNDDLFQIFGAYGEVKEIRETPNKRHHKFIEFFDVRAAEAALKALNKSDIAGKRIKLEPSRPGGARRNLMLQLNQDLEPDEPRNLYHQVGSPITNSPPVTGNWMQKNSPIENSPLQNLSTSPSFATMNSLAGNPMSGLASILHPQASKGAPIHKDQVRIGHVEHLFNHKIGFPNSHSLLESKLSHFSGNFSSGSSASNCSGIETLSRSQFLWGSPKLNAEHTNASLWSMPSLGPAYTSNTQKHGFPYPGRNGSFSSSPHYHLHHHVGSAPSGVGIERQLGFFQESSDTSLMNPVAFGNISLGHNDGILRKKMGAPHGMNSGIATLGNMPDKGSTMLSSPRLSPMYLGSGLYSGMTSHMEGLVDRGRSRRFENSTGQVDNKKQFLLDLEKIKNGEDSRTTLMIKNIPNKYTSKMLLAAIDESNRGTYDFIYLPIDFKNKCNVGYAFINMLSPSLIIPFYQAFNGKKWEKFNSEKVASLAYARIQGKAALVTHFQNSSLMNEDKRCRPILFHPEGSEADDQLNGLRLGGSAETQ